MLKKHSIVSFPRKRESISCWFYKDWIPDKNFGNDRKRVFQQPVNLPEFMPDIYGPLLLFLFLLLVICVIELDYLFCQVCLLRTVDYAGLCLKYECIALFLCQLFCNLQ